MVSASRGRIGVVAAGAGARGAYEAGALSALLPRMAAEGRRPSVLVGTSAGALNALGLASLAHLPAEAAASALPELWSEVRLSDVTRVPRSLLMGSLEYGGQLLGLPTRLPALLETSQLEATLTRVIDWPQMHENIKHGPIDALAVAATSAATGGTVVFVEKKRSVKLPPPSRSRNIQYVETTLTPQHVLASTAVPLAFRPIFVDTPERWRGWYVDGGLRLNVPLQPAIDFGCDYLGVVSTQPSTWPQDPPRSQLEAAVKPDVFAEAALALRVLLADRMIEDMYRLQRTNELIAAHPNLLGYRHIDVLFGGPASTQADDIALLANRVFRQRFSGLHAARNPSLWLLNRLIGGYGVSHGDLLSFVFFDPAFTAAAAELGVAQVSAQLGLARADAEPVDASDSASASA